MPNRSQDPGTVDPAAPLPSADPERIINPPRPDAAPGDTSAERIINPPRPDAETPSEA